MAVKHADYRDAVWNCDLDEAKGLLRDKRFREARVVIRDYRQERARQEVAEIIKRARASR